MLETLKDMLSMLQTPHRVYVPREQRTAVANPPATESTTDQLPNGTAITHQQPIAIQAAINDGSLPTDDTITDVAEPPASNDNTCQQKAGHETNKLDIDTLNTARMACVCPVTGRNLLNDVVRKIPGQYGQGDLTKSRDDRVAEVGKLIRTALREFWGGMSPKGFKNQPRCAECKAFLLECDGSIPCGNCSDVGFECHYEICLPHTCSNLGDKRRVDCDRVHEILLESIQNAVRADHPHEDWNEIDGELEKFIAKHTWDLPAYHDPTYQRPQGNVGKHPKARPNDGACVKRKLGGSVGFAASNPPTVLLEAFHDLAGTKAKLAAAEEKRRDAAKAKAKAKRGA